MHMVQGHEVLKKLSVMGALVALTACGGGGSDGSAADDMAAGGDAADVVAPVDTGADPADGHSLAPEVGDTVKATTADISVPGTVSLPYPTMQHVSVEWAFTGDANANAVVKVRQRVKGTATWTAGMPLRRVRSGSSSGFSWLARHSGTVFGLKPATSYEIELALVDPNGGSTTRVVTATTRAVPAAMAGAPVKTATPATLHSVLAAAMPGDVVQLGVGTYPAFQMTRDGDPGKPIVIRGVAGTVFNGELLFHNREHVILDSVRVNGTVRFDSTRHFALTRSTLQAVSNIRGGSTVVAYGRAENAYIADNTITGTTGWTEAALGVNGANLGEGIQFTGPGHVVMNNRIKGFRDNISFMEGDEAIDQFSIDVLNNDLSIAADDAIEADFCRHNCRIMGNRITNAFIGLSSQPGLGGPTYFVRNTLYNIAHVAFKFYRGSHGDVVLNNTVVKGGDGFGVYAGVPVHSLYSRNNLFIGGAGGAYGGYDNGSGKALQVPDLVVATADMDYDGFGAASGTLAGRFGTVSYSGLAGLRASTTERHAQQVTLAVFNTTVGLPSAAMTAYAAPDLRLRSGSAAQDVGIAIPGITTGFTGTAPDLGAHEVGTPLPVVGPR